MVLPWIKDFQKGRRRIATKITAELVDFVEHDDRVVGAAAADVLDQSPRHRTDVGPAVAADLRLVTHTTHGDPGKLASKRLRD